MLKLLKKVLSWQSSGKWKMIHEAVGNHPESAFMLRSSLQSKGIHCRMRKIGSSYNGLGSLTYRVEVKEDDVAPARAILTETLRHIGR